MNIRLAHNFLQLFQISSAFLWLVCERDILIDRTKLFIHFHFVAIDVFRIFVSVSDIEFCLLRNVHEHLNEMKWKTVLKLTSGIKHEFE